jgi:UDP-glucose 4-epimerase
MSMILVTGATGFIGGRLVPRLLERGWHVLALGRTAPRMAGVTFLPGDFHDAEKMLRDHHAALQRVDAVVHLGGFVLHSSRPEDDDSLSSRCLNIEATTHLLRHLPSTLSCLCYTSTVDVYGPPAALPVTEDHPTLPVSSYGRSKLATEHLLQDYRTHTGLPVAILRLSQVFGPGDTSAKAIPNFIRAALRGEPLPVQGDGSDVRDYVYVDDVVAAILQALEQRANGVFNIACGEGHSIREVVTTILRAGNFPAQPQWQLPRRPPSRFVFDIARARERLGYVPRVTLEEGLRWTVAWFRDETKH